MRTDKDEVVDCLVSADILDYIVEQSPLFLRCVPLYHYLPDDRHSESPRKHAVKELTCGLLLLVGGVTTGCAAILDEGVGGVRTQ